MDDVGMTRPEAALLLGLLIGGVLVGAFLTSWLTDRAITAWRNRK